MKRFKRRLIASRPRSVPEFEFNFVFFAWAAKLQRRLQKSRNLGLKNMAGSWRATTPLLICWVLTWIFLESSPKYCNDRSCTKNLRFKYCELWKNLCVSFYVPPFFWILNFCIMPIVINSFNFYLSTWIFFLRNK